jgi:alkenylglycerophosphocholine/alkenylglycerophosphoethanolamine hydrolase
MVNIIYMNYSWSKFTYLITNILIESFYITLNTLRKYNLLQLILKPLPLINFINNIYNTKEYPKYIMLNTYLICMGLLFGIIGDILLQLSTFNTFILGAISFLIGHIFYIIGFSIYGYKKEDDFGYKFNIKYFIIFSIIISCLFNIIFVLLKLDIYIIFLLNYIIILKLELLYFITSLNMKLLESLSIIKKYRYYRLVGVIMFIVSDYVIIFERLEIFKLNILISNIIIMTLYYFGQYFISVSTLEYKLSFRPDCSNKISPN